MNPNLPKTRSLAVKNQFLGVSQVLLICKPPDASRHAKFGLKMPYNTSRKTPPPPMLVWKMTPFPFTPGFVDKISHD